MSVTMMEDKSTSIAKDTSADLIKLRLPYLEKELTNKNGFSSSSLQRSNSMIARVTYHTPRALHVENVSEAYYRNGTQKSRGKFLVGSGSIDRINHQLNKDSVDTEILGYKKLSKRHVKKEENLPRIDKSMIMARYTERSLFLDGKRLDKCEAPARPQTQSGKFKAKSHEKLNHIGAMTVLNPGGQPDFSPIHRSKTESEIVDQAKEMLKDSGFSEENVLKQDIQKLGKGLSTMYLTDYGVHNERANETAGMSQHKRLLSSDKLDDEIGFTAQKHIYMCQIPSLLTRGSQGRRSVHSLLRTINPRAYSRALENNYTSDEEDGYISRLGSPRKPMILVSEKSTLHDQEGLKKKSYYRSVDTINLGNDKAPIIDIQGTPVSVYVTSRRILNK